jgi:hypothetical protein
MRAFAHPTQFSQATGGGTKAQSGSLRRRRRNWKARRAFHDFISCPQFSQMALPSSTRRVRCDVIS